MSDFLQIMAARSAERAAAVDSGFVSSDFDKPVLPLVLGDFDLIAEIKDHSPAEGALATASSNRAERAACYASGGAAAISILTEPSRFSGSLEHLEEVVAAVPATPVMRKDFLVEPVQVLEARNSGASGVLLIAAMLHDDKLREMLDCCYEHGLFVLLESFDEDDLRRSRELLDNAQDSDRASAGQLLFGVNTRNLRTLEVDSNRLANLSAQLPQGKNVAESGLRTAEDAAAAARLGYAMGLVGTALMRSDDPEALVRAMIEAGRAIS